MGVRTGSAEARLTIDLTGIERIPITFATRPHISIWLLGLDAVGTRELGGDPVLRGAVRRALRRASSPGLLTMLHPEGVRVWDGLAPAMRMEERPYRAFDGIDRDPVLFRHVTEAAHRGQPPAVWRPALNRPLRFFDNYTRDCAAVWQEIAPMFDLGRTMERETNRVGWAAVRGALPEFLASVLPGATLRGRRLSVTLRVRPLAVDCTLASDGLTIGPELAGLGVGTFNTTPGTNRIATICYPVPVGPRPAVAPPVMPEPASLAALLGAPRATVLRSLDRPRSAGELADILGSSPASLTYQVDRLVAAGLVRRIRRDRHIMVSRTTRGDRLLGLYEERGWW